jgi:two-component system OmpR family response regulator
MHLLVVEDDEVLADAISKQLRRMQYAVDTVRSGGAADGALAHGAYDLVVLDIELPVLDGFEVLRRLRSRRSRMPVLILTARDAIHDRVRGLDLGADDYLVKPFDMQEFEARVRALIRRNIGAGEQELRVGRLTFNLLRRDVFVDGQWLQLPARELALLELLVQRVGRVVSKSALLQGAYEWDEEVGPNAIEVHIHRLRRKLFGAGVEIRTVRGLGYLLKGEEPRVRAA